ncbi:MAG: hypothetical protein IIA99_07670, partial [Proteobacteria bacterium]|nr:hypothetical protein [Pseudomonadota bacterium]
DAILVKDIHDEMREMHRLRILKNTFIVDGMRYHLNKEIGGQIYYSNKGDVSPEIFDLVTRWQNGDESVGQPFLALIRKAGLTLAELQLRAFESKFRHLTLVDDLMARHQKNIKESFKLIDMRHNNALVRQRIEQELQRLSGNKLEVVRDES